MNYKLRDTVTNIPHLITSGETLIGRSDEAGVIVDHTSISRHHARIVNTEQGIWIQDMGSTNGTVVRGEFIGDGVLLAVGDIIQIGDIVFRLDPEKTSTPEPEKPTLKTSQTLRRERFKHRTERMAVGEIQEIASQISPGVIPSPPPPAVNSPSGATPSMPAPVSPRESPAQAAVPLSSHTSAGALPPKALVPERKPLMRPITQNFAVAGSPDTATVVAQAPSHPTPPPPVANINIGLGATPTATTAGANPYIVQPQGPSFGVGIGIGMGIGVVVGAVGTYLVIS